VKYLIGILNNPDTAIFAFDTLDSMFRKDARIRRLVVRFCKAEIANGKATKSLFEVMGRAVENSWTPNSATISSQF
jgi:hypothetical protein